MARRRRGGRRQKRRGAKNRRGRAIRKYVPGRGGVRL